MTHQELESALKDATKQISVLTGHVAYLHETYTKKIAGLKEDFERVDDAASYWKENFENLYNDIVMLVTTDGEELTDGEVVDDMFDVLRKYQGESDEQITIKL